MKKKKWVVPIVIIGVIIALWFTGIIPKQIAQIAGTSYVKEHFPEMQLECIGVEYADAFGDYLITFEDKNEKVYSCVIGAPQRILCKRFSTKSRISRFQCA